jgi:hypothetical protein
MGAMKSEVGKYMGAKIAQIEINEFKILILIQN